MPKRYFVCPDGEQVEIKDCLDSCRMAHRCATKPFLRMAGEDRRWSGHASVTMLERCVRQRWLMERKDYSEVPTESAFRILGTGTHEKLDKLTDEKEGEESESLMDIDGIRGVVDLVEEDDGEYILTDTKTVGSYAVAKMAGITKIGEEPIFSEDGEPVLYVRGPKKGTQKTDPIYGFDPDSADISQYQVQPNLYRLAWEAMNPGKKITRMYIQAIVRDGGLITAKGRGVLRNLYLIPVPFMDDKPLKEWANRRREEIEGWMNGEEIPPVGSKEEVWGGAFCQKFCPVREHCRAIGDNPYLGGTA